MERERILFKTEERRSSSEIAAFLRQLAHRIVEEEDKRGKVKRKLEVEIEWVLGAENEPDNQAVTV